MISHPDDATIERFAIGALEDDAAFVAHVGGCEACSAKLRQEATLELSLMEVQEARIAAVAKSPAGHEVARRFIAPAAVFAAAAAVIVYVGREAALSRARSADIRPVPVVVCPDGPKQAACVAEAHRSGSYLEYPRGGDLAALGSEPGLTLSVSPADPPEPPIPELEATLASLRAPFKKCIEDGLTTQTAMTMTGAFSVRAELDPEGKLRDAPGMIVHLEGPSPKARMPEYVRAAMPCILAAFERAPFRGNGKATQVQLTVKFVWRE